MSSPNAGADDLKMGKDWKADWPKHLPELLQQLHEIGCYWIQTTLPDVWVTTAATHQLLFSHDHDH